MYQGKLHPDGERPVALELLFFMTDCVSSCCEKLPMFVQVEWTLLHRGNPWPDRSGAYCFTQDFVVVVVVFRRIACCTSDAVPGPSLTRTLVVRTQNELLYKGIHVEDLQRSDTAQSLKKKSVLGQSLTRTFAVQTQQGLYEGIRAERTRTIFVQTERMLL